MIKLKKDKMDLKSIESARKSIVTFFKNEKRKKDIREGIVTFLAILFILSTILFTGHSCVKMIDDDRAAYQYLIQHRKFFSGDLVKSKVSGQTGQVIDVTCFIKSNQCYYKVRFNAVNTRTNTSIIGRDGFMENYPIVTIEVLEFELEKIK